MATDRCGRCYTCKRLKRGWVDSNDEEEDIGLWTWLDRKLKEDPDYMQKLQKTDEEGDVDRLSDAQLELVERWWCKTKKMDKEGDLDKVADAPKEVIDNWDLDKVDDAQMKKEIENLD